MVLPPKWMSSLFSCSSARLPLPVRLNVRLSAASARPSPETVIPAVDTVAQLKRYALEKGVDSEKWNLVTGDKKEIYDLARKSYLAAKSQGDGGPFDMIHTENFVLVDKEKRIRGFYDGTDPGAIEELMADLETLKKEYK